MAAKQIDLNCDLGESFGRYQIGQDEQLMPLISSCNIACGFHAGDPLVISRTIKLALRHGLRIGAHPAYPDLQGFGRRAMHIPPDELKAIIKYQVAALRGLVESEGGRLTYVKPHGALYNAAADQPATSKLIAEAILEMRAELAFMGMAGTCMEQTAKAMDMPFIPEAFADRRYTASGCLMPRKEKAALIAKPELAAEQALLLATKREVMTTEGKAIEVAASSLCVHGDHHDALAILQAIRHAFAEHEIEVNAV